MNEKILIQTPTRGTRNFMKKFSIFAVVVSFLVNLILFIILEDMFSSPAEFFGSIAGTFLMTALFAVPAILIAALVCHFFSGSLVITDKRVYGRIAFGRQVDLPLDKVSSVWTQWWMKGIAIGTSSGNIKFLFVDNQGEIYQVLSNLLIQRQAEEKQSHTVVNAAPSNADELKKYKELLDAGVITQEEYDAKKKQLLGL